MKMSKSNWRWKIYVSTIFSQKIFDVHAIFYLIWIIYFAVQIWDYAWIMTKWYLILSKQCLIASIDCLHVKWSSWLNVHMFDLHFSLGGYTLGHRVKAYGYAYLLLIWLSFGETDHRRIWLSFGLNNHRRLVLRCKL